MSSNDCSTQDYLHLPEDQVGNNFVPMRIPNNNDNSINYHVGISNSNDTVPSDTFEFYLPLPNDTIYRVTYTKLRVFEIATLLNNGGDISHIPDSYFPYHQNGQGFIHQQTHQQVQQHIHQQVHQHIHQLQQQSQTYDTISNPQVDMIPLNSQVNTNNNTYNNVIHSNEAISENTRYDTNP
ncbi:hypothetical protein RhiirA5_418106 [Rhizophagus irregularis]|uniref:Uncharacterized protein n=2 Tax=Rhizophagus irregularis TaxID=588596 RepID=A0A2I1DTM6_9GLOM|nr:hypothetical protein RhiirA5_418106 [Rhizophagus irregularis]PKY13233.1 hypothetical protein RhiirB3_425009 [Rhizophagus irregularis]CAB4486539.1 unnamed protein product [Rhizophagus irregularis]CAB5217603.1 unnamed protein product [Rhizophagus irregularis]CAB5378140.1 unnamed protein product [Rhizophagus irregularis]